MNLHAIDWMNLKINVLIELAMKFQDREQSFFHNANGRKVQQMSDPFLIKYQNVLLPYTWHGFLRVQPGNFYIEIILTL
jgi:hypothetical protein